MSLSIEYCESLPVKRKLFRIVPSMRVEDLRNQCCAIWNLVPENHQLHSKNSILAPAETIRFLNLAVGDKLLLKSAAQIISLPPTQITIALVVDANRYIGEFKSSITLWEMLMSFETKHCIGIVSADAKVPILLCLNRQFEPQEMKSTTLNSSGLVNGTLARLSWKFLNDKDPLVNFQIGAHPGVAIQSINAKISSANATESRKDAVKILDIGMSIDINDTNQDLCKLETIIPNLGSNLIICDTTLSISNGASPLETCIVKYPLNSIISDLVYTMANPEKYTQCTFFQSAENMFKTSPNSSRYILHSNSKRAAKLT